MLDIEAENWIATGYKGTVVNDGRGNTLALHPGCDKPIEEIGQIARLMAAAPHMYRTLQKAWDWINTNGPPIGSVEMLNEILAAIHLADGEGDYQS